MNLTALLVDLCRQELKRAVSPDDNLLEDGLTINRALRIIDRFWRETSIELDVNSFYLWPSPKALARAVENGSYLNLPKIIEIRKGCTDKTLIVFAGGLSCFLEIQDFIQRLHFPGRILGMSLTPFDNSSRDPAVVEDEIRTCLTALKDAGIPGPYCLIGYSFGGVLALELARAMKDADLEVTFLGLIDTPQSEYNWPLSVWLRFMLKRLTRRLKTTRYRLDPTAIPPPRQSGRDGGLSTRHPWTAIAIRAAGIASYFRPFLFRFRNPRHPNYPTMAPQWIGNYPPGYDRMARQLLRMKGLYRPRLYTGALTFYRALGGSPIDCDPKTLWEAFLPDAEWIDLRGNHQSIVIGRNAETLARDLDHRLDKCLSRPSDQCAK
ncbi:alpha/beta fold hydrolase [Agrobacterium vitis]|uniref:Alpha/beta fold hydrolase n=1 Tax=Agrobacterium vitis TaxID=373 RepID=A0A7K1RAL1_AGRVI|nr:alpha/beta fold hydrolase [Agrobacterium vitis]MVA55103.1 alpha/beta fold hydrolase [Agrobacterium vitis]